MNNYYLGRYQLGDWVPLTVWCRDGSGTPTLPTDPPAFTVTDGAAAVKASGRLPIVAPDDITAKFHFLLRLGHAFAAGNYSVAMNYTVGATPMVDTATFEIVPGGHVDGSGLAMHYFTHPRADWILKQSDSGAILKLRNPRLKP